MLRFSLGLTRMDRLKPEHFRGTAHVRCFGGKAREVRLRWFEHARRRDSERIGGRMQRLELSSSRPYAFRKSSIGNQFSPLASLGSPHIEWLSLSCNCIIALCMARVAGGTLMMFSIPRMVQKKQNAFPGKVGLNYF